MATSTPGRPPNVSATMLAEALNYLGLFGCPKGRAVLAKQCLPKQREELLRRAVAQAAQAVGELDGRVKFGELATEAKRLGASAPSGDVAALERDAVPWACSVARAVGLPAPAAGSREAQQCPVHGTQCPTNIPGMK